MRYSRFFFSSRRRHTSFGCDWSSDVCSSDLFHEGGHAADRLASEQEETCLNTEWPPASIAWAETHSQFMDTMLSSIEWRTRYAKNREGAPYPLDLFERKVRKLRIEIGRASCK